MSKLITTTYRGIPDFDEYGEIVISQDTAQYIVDHLFAKNVFAGRISVGEGTFYQMVFVDMDKGRRILAPFESVVKTSWIGGGRLYIGIERRTGFAFALNHPLHPGYVAEKLEEKCTPIAKNISDLLNFIAVKQPTEYVLELMKLGQIKS